MIKTIGDRNYLIEDIPLDDFKLHESCIVIWGDKLYKFKENWNSGHINNILTYYTCILEELYGNNFFHTGTSECYKVIASDAKKLNKKYNLKDIEND